MEYKWRKSKQSFANELWRKKATNRMVNFVFKMPIDG